MWPPFASECYSLGMLLWADSFPIYSCMELRNEGLPLSLENL